MSALFADTFYIIALLSSSDRAHHRAMALTRKLSSKLLTTTAVLTEVADGMGDARSRGNFVRFLDRFRSRSDVTVVPCDTELFDAGMVLFRHRLDKDWSLTDCISFVIMERAGVTEALTGDHHFEQAGFIALLK